MKQPEALRSFFGPMNGFDDLAETEQDGGSVGTETVQEESPEQTDEPAARKETPRETPKKPRRKEKPSADRASKADGGLKSAIQIPYSSFIRFKRLLFDEKESSRERKVTTADFFDMLLDAWEEKKAR